MRHNDRKCGCGAIFQLPTLMSRETSCYACSRKKAEAVMLARKGEMQPNGVGPGARHGDVVATGWIKRPEPLRVPVAPRGLATPAITKAYKETLQELASPAWNKGEGTYNGCSEYEWRVEDGKMLEIAKASRTGAYWCRLSPAHAGEVSPRPDRVRQDTFTYFHDCVDRSHAIARVEDASTKYKVVP